MSKSVALLKSFTASLTLISSISAFAQTQTVQDATKNINHTGDLTVNNVAKGVQINVKEGGLRVLGKVEDGAKLIQEGGEAGNVVINGGNGIVISGASVGGSIIVNGVDISQQVRQAQGNKPASTINGIEIQGAVGERVQVRSTSQIKMKAAGAYADIYAGNGLTMTNIGANSSVTAGNGANVGIVGEGTRLQAGNSINAYGFCAKAFVTAGNSVQAQFSHTTARVTAGNGMSLAGAEAVGCNLK